MGITFQHNIFQGPVILLELNFGIVKNIQKKHSKVSFVSYLSQRLMAVYFSSCGLLLGRNILGCCEVPLCQGVTLTKLSISVIFLVCLSCRFFPPVGRRRCCRKTGIKRTASTDPRDMRESRIKRQRQDATTE